VPLAAQGSWANGFNHEKVPSPNATDHLIPWGGYTNPGIQYFSYLGATYSWPNAMAPNNIMFKAVHMALIPKGPYQGMVLVWNDTPVLIRAPGYGPTIPANHYWSCQAYSIIDPAEQPVGPRFRNFLLPIAHLLPVNPTSPNDEPADLFCAGHTWSRDGDLIVAGGTIWSASAGTLLGPKITYAWNPDEPVGGWPPLHGTPSLYPGAFGLWKQGPQLQQDRWYPTTTMSAPLTRLVPQREVVIVFGGSNNVFGSASVNTSWNNYEALRVDAPCSPSGSGLSTDDILGVKTWPGPGTYTGTTPMAPGSTTHHSDMNMRYHEVPVRSAAPNAVKFTTPQNALTAPRGIYMLFVKASNGSVSQATWVYLP
jgi:hypothetical protein